MKNIVITGSTRGIGRGLASQFLRSGCVVTISGRTQEGVDKACTELAGVHGVENVFGRACDVTQYHEVQALWDTSSARFGKIDIWINNAGVGHSRASLWKLSAEEIRAAVETNLVGAINGSAVAARGMLEQGFGAIYNLGGLGSDGRIIEGLTVYGSTKYGITYLTDALVRETRGTPLVVGSIRPGMVVTELLTKPFEGHPEEFERAKKVFNILAERVETVTPWIARRILENRKTGVVIRWSTTARIVRRFLTAPFVKRNLFD
jgi:NAD(P)-dependent dehydrogenase (short-subunit alcohol dehydrogenase family)